jgi:hypothetical protein
MGATISAEELAALPVNAITRQAFRSFPMPIAATVATP